MALQLPDILVFVLFFLVVVGVSLWKSRRGKGSEDYFLAGRGLPWWMIGISIVAANISTEQFVGMAGQGAGLVTMRGAVIRERRRGAFAMARTYGHRRLLILILPWITVLVGWLYFSLVRRHREGGTGA